MESKGKDRPDKRRMLGQTRWPVKAPLLPLALLREESNNASFPEAVSLSRRTLALSIPVLAGVVLHSSLPSQVEPARPEPPASQVSPPQGGASHTTRLQGTARIDRNRPVLGATVIVRAESGARDLYVTSTDGKGAFHFDGLPEASYTVEFHRDGLETIRKQEIVLRFPFRGIVEVVMKPLPKPPAPSSSPRASESGTGTLKLEGVALAQAGQPVPEVRVRLARVDGSQDPRDVLSQGDGTFALEGLTHGDWRLESLGLGFVPIRMDLSLEVSIRVTLLLVPLSPNSEPSPLDLMPHEEPIPPPQGS